jgi:hypothetical protein
MTGKHLDFDLDYDSEGLTRPARRPLTEQEKEWINAILQANKMWVDVTIGDIYVDGECTCGCHTVHLERPSQPQNARTADVFHETVGMMWVFTDAGKVIGITLHAKRGSLGELEVVYQENTEPWPSTWRETSRKLVGEPFDPLKFSIG